MKFINGDTGEDFESPEHAKGWLSGPLPAAPSPQRIGCRASGNRGGQTPRRNPGRGHDPASSPNDRDELQAGRQIEVGAQTRPAEVRRRARQITNGAMPRINLPGGQQHVFDAQDFPQKTWAEIAPLMLEGGKKSGRKRTKAD